MRTFSGKRSTLALWLLPRHRDVGLGCGSTGQQQALSLALTGDYLLPGVSVTVKM